jgi:transcriptional regulator with XRE-family HTH domain
MLICMDALEAEPAKGRLAVRRISQREAAQALGCSPEHLCAVLNGRSRASDDFKQRLATYLGEPVDQLFRGARRCRCGREVAV